MDHGGSTRDANQHIGMTKKHRTFLRKSAATGPDQTSGPIQMDGLKETRTKLLADLVELADSSWSKKQCPTFSNE